MFQALVNATSSLRNQQLSGSSILKWIHKRPSARTSPQGAQPSANPSRRSAELRARASGADKLVYIEGLHMHPLRVLASYTPTGDFASAKASLHQSSSQSTASRWEELDVVQCLQCLHAHLHVCTITLQCNT